MKKSSLVKNLVKSHNILVLLIIILSLIVSIYGFFSNEIVYKDKIFQSINGEYTMIYGKGIYYNDSREVALQARAQDIVTLIIGIPLLIISIFFANKKSLRGKLLLTGTLGYFLYTYTSYSFLAMYNKFFLIYVMLMSLSFFAFILNITSEELKNINIHFSEKLPNKFIGIFTIIIGFGICLIWLEKIFLSFNHKKNFIVGVEHYTTLVTQALDLGFIVPVAILSGVSIIYRKSLGYLLTPIILIKGATLFLLILSGVYFSIIGLIVFPLFTLICIFNLYLVMKNIK